MIAKSKTNMKHVVSEIGAGLNNQETTAKQKKNPWQGQPPARHPYFQDPRTLENKMCGIPMIPGH